jgi:hypothetical protein
MITAKIGPLDHVVILEIEAYGWSQVHDAPHVILKGGRTMAALDFKPNKDSYQATKAAAVQALVDHVAKSWNDATTIQLAVPEPALPPVPRYEGANVRDATSGRLIEHDEGAHGDDAKAILRCRVCTPQP